MGIKTLDNMLDSSFALDSALVTLAPSLAVIGQVSIDFGSEFTLFLELFLLLLAFIVDAVLDLISPHLVPVEE